MTWALRHQLFYLGILALFISGIAFFVVYPSLSRAPTCMDGRMNGVETGVDCGGSCLLACRVETEEISVLWARSFEVVPGRYNAVAYLRNHNENKVAEGVAYRFRFADKNNLYLGDRRGTVFVPPNGNFAVFEGGINMETAEPVYTTLEFESVPIWLQVSNDKVDQLKVITPDIELINEATNPYLTATLRNNSLFEIPEVSAVAILYDIAGNAVNTSHTVISDLEGEEERIINFTWPEPFKAAIVRTEIIPMFNVHRVEWK